MIKEVTPTTPQSFPGHLPTTNQIKHHYQHPNIKENIIRCSHNNNTSRAGNYDFHGWYKNLNNKKHLYNLAEDYDEITAKTDRSLYWTLNLFNNTTFQKNKNGDEPLGTGEDTCGYSLALDIDIKDQYNINKPHAKLSLEQCVKFFYDKLHEYLKHNIYAAFSGGGAYIYLHHQLFKLPPEIVGEVRWDHWALLRNKFQLFMEDISEEFFQLNPEAKEYIKIDYLNHEKRIFKTIFSVHKDYDLAVIPLQPPTFQIHPSDAQLPLTEDIIHKTQHWYTYTPDKEGKNKLLKKLKEYEDSAESINNIQKLNIKTEKPVSPVKIELNNDIICPVMQAILSPQGWGHGVHRRIVVATIYLSHLGWNYQEIYQHLHQLSRGWEKAQGIKRLIKVWMKIQMPNYQTLYSPGSFPVPGFHDFQDKLPPIPEGIKDSIRYTITRIEAMPLKAEMGDTTLLFKFRGNHKYDYTIQEEGRTVYNAENKDETPIQLNRNHEIYRQLKSYAEKFSNDPDTDVRELLTDLNNQRQDYYSIKDFKQKYIDNLHHYKDEANLEEAQRLLESMENPLIYIGSVVDWMVAGERLNVLFGFVSAMNLLIFGEPINYIAVGPPAGGKSVIEETIFQLLPEENVCREKKATIASIFRRSQKNPKYYDKKIIYMGDLGGEKDIENSEEARNIFKELNSDGRVSRPVSDKDNKFETKDLTLEGQPALFYTTVHDYKMDDQEISRGFVITPKDDNDEMVKQMQQYLYVAKGKTRQEYDTIIGTEPRNIRNIVRYLMTKNEAIIFNPYADAMWELINKSPFIKRDHLKIIKLAETITLLNYNNRKEYTTPDGTTYIITTQQDIHFLYGLIKNYMNSIYLNVPNSLIELYKKLKTQYPGAASFTVKDVRLDLDTKGQQNTPEQLRKLAEAGLLQIITKKTEGNMNIYQIVSTDLKDLPQESLEISEKWRKIIEKEHSPELLQFILKYEDTKNLEIKNFKLPGHTKPPWTPKKDKNKNKDGKWF